MRSALTDQLPCPHDGRHQQGRGMMSRYLLVSFAIASALDGLMSSAAEPISLFDQLTRSGISPKIDIENYPTALVAAYQAHMDYVTGIDVTPNGSLLVSCSLHGTVKLWELGGNRLQEHNLVVQGEDEERLLWVKISSDGKRLAFGGDTKFLQVWDLVMGSSARKFCDIGPMDGVVSSGSLGNKDRLVIVRRTVLEVRDLSKKSFQQPSLTAVVPHKELGKVPNSFRLALSRDGQTVAAAATDGTLRVWLIKDNHLKTIMDYQENSWVRAVSVSPDGNLLASTSDGHSVEIWKIAPLPAKKLAKLERGSLIRVIVFFPSGNLLASADRGGRVRVWDVSRRERLHEFTLPDRVTSLVAAPDERHLIVGTAKGMICVLRLSPSGIDNKRVSDKKSE